MPRLSEPCTARRHGTPTAYRDDHCRCPEARTAIALEKAAYRKRLYLQGKSLIDRTGTLRRVQALMAMGWACRDIAARIGYARPDDLLRPGRPILRETAERVARLYEELCMTPGPSVRARAIAARRGYAPPLAWDDDTIDDPNALPDLGGEDSPEVDEVAIRRAMAGSSVTLSRTERAEVIRRLVAEVGYGECQRRLGVSGSVISRAMRGERVPAPRKPVAA